MLNGKKKTQRLILKGLAVMTLLLIMTMPLSQTATTNTSKNQQHTNPNNYAKEEASPTVSTYWAKAYGGNNYDGAACVQQTTDGGYIVAGGTESFGENGYRNAWVLKLDSTGDITWQKIYGGNTSWSGALAVEQTSDGGYIVAGYTRAYGAGQDDAWILKLNSTGDVSWQRTYGGAGDDVAYSVRQTADGGYIVAGYTTSFGAGNEDFWVLKLDSTGSVAWQKTYGGSSDDEAHSIEQTRDGGYVVAGFTWSFGAGEGDFWVLKLNATGGVTWQNTYGGSKDDDAWSVKQTADGGYIVAGVTMSFGAGFYDAWVLKLNVNGSITWNEGSGASTHATNVTPNNSNASVSTTSANPEPSNLTTTITFATPQDTDATVTIQSGGETGIETPLIIALSALAFTMSAVVVLAVAEHPKRKGMTVFVPPCFTYLPTAPVSQLRETDKSVSSGLHRKR